jgi:Uma2 family endonuclease
MAMPAVHDWTIDMLDALPESSERHEIIDGELFVTPSPTGGHQFVLGRLYLMIAQYLEVVGNARVIFSPSDVWRDERRRNRVQPDLFVLRLIDGKVPPFPFHLSTILLAVEVVSPGNPLLDYQVKRDLYPREGVEEFWVVNPDARNISRWVGRDDPGEVLSRRIEWRAPGVEAACVIDLPEFFAKALD